MDFNAIREQLASVNGKPGMPADEQKFESFERRYHLKLPVDVKLNYSIMNGAEHYTDGHGSWMRFWPIEDWRPAHQEFPDDGVVKFLPAQVFICADYAYECVYFVIDLDTLSPTFAHVYGLGGTRAGLAATSFSEFVTRVSENSDDLHCYG